MSSRSSDVTRHVLGRYSDLAAPPWFEWPSFITASSCQFYDRPCYHERQYSLPA